MEEKKGQLISDSRDKFQPINYKGYIGLTNGICKESYDWLIEVAQMLANYCSCKS